MFNIGAGELVLILVVALIVLGPQRLPEFARTIGKFVRDFRRQTDEVRTVVEREFYKMDQEFQDEPRPKVPGPIPAAMPSHAPPVPPATPAALPEAHAVVVSDPSAPVAEPVPVGPTSSSSEPPVAGSVPVPGTVARNAPAPKSDG